MATPDRESTSSYVLLEEKVRAMEVPMPDCRPELRQAMQQLLEFDAEVLRAQEPEVRQFLYARAHELRITAPKNPGEGEEVASWRNDAEEALRVIRNRALENRAAA